MTEAEAITSLRRSINFSIIHELVHFSFFKHQSGFGMQSAHTYLKYILLYADLSYRVSGFIINPFFYSANTECLLWARHIPKDGII